MAKLGPEYGYRRPYDLLPLISFDAEVFSERIEAFLTELDSLQSEWGGLMVEVERVQAEDAATDAAIANPSASKNTGFRPPKRQGGRQ